MSRIMRWFSSWKAVTSFWHSASDGIAPDVHLQPQFGAILHGAAANDGWVCRMTGHRKGPYGVLGLVADRHVALVAEVFLELLGLGQAVEESLGLLRGPAAQVLGER